MHTHEAPLRIEQNIAVQQVGTETLIYDEVRHKAFCLNECSAAVWRLCNGSSSPAHIAELVTLELSRPIDESVVAFAIEELRRDGLVQAAAAAARGISRRTAIQRLGIGGAMLLPAISSIVAPTAAQAYSGCFDCSSVSSSSLRVQRARAAAANNANSGLLGPLITPLGETAASTPQTSSGPDSAFPALGASPNLLP